MNLFGGFDDLATAIQSLRGTAWQIAVLFPVWWQVCRVLAETTLDAARRRDNPTNRSD